MWVFAGPRDPSTKPSRSWLRVVVRKPRLFFAEIRATWNKVTAKAGAYWRGCSGAAPGCWVLPVLLRKMYPQNRQKKREESRGFVRVLRFCLCVVGFRETLTYRPPGN